MNTQINQIKKVAVIQMVSSTDPTENQEHMSALVSQAAKAGAQWVVLPEYWSILGQHDTDKLAYAEEFGTGNIQAALSHLAKTHNIILFSGSIPLTSPEKDKAYNSLLVYDTQGETISRYDKMHLFGFNGLGERYQESDTLLAGRTLPQLKIEQWRIAQGICFDLRFPEFFRAQGEHEVMILPAAFTYTTGKAHWEILLRARAIENQSYVLAAAQGGKHQNGRQTFGHSMIIDPWGEIIDCLPEGEGIVYAELNLAKIDSLRNKLPTNNRQVPIGLDCHK